MGPAWRRPPHARRDRPTRRGPPARNPSDCLAVPVALTLQSRGREETTMRVNDVMSRKVVTIGPADNCLEAVGRMHRGRIRHLPVVDREQRLIGIVTDRDLRHHLFSPAIFPVLGQTSLDTLLMAATVGDLMTTTVVTIGPQDSLAEAARLMMERKIGSLPVTENSRVVGILTETDMLRLIAQGETGAPECAEIIVSVP